MIFAVQVFDLTLRTENYVTTPGLVLLIRAFVSFCFATYFPDHCMLFKLENYLFPDIKLWVAFLGFQIKITNNRTKNNVYIQIGKNYIDIYINLIK